MNTRSATRARFTVAKALAATTAVLALLTLFINMPWFDEPLHPELAALREPRPVSMEDNAYASALAFLAARQKNPQRAGQQIVEALRKKHAQGQRIALDPDEMAAFLGRPNLDETWQADFASLNCNARMHLNCADRLITELEAADSVPPRLDLLLDRYSAMLDQRRFEENQERDVFSPMPPYRHLMDVGRLRLALSYASESTPEFLRKSAEDFDFWLRVLRESDTLVAKMVSLAGLRNNLDFISTSMRNRELDESEVRRIRAFVRPLTGEERDIGEAFVSEARIALLSETPPILARSSWPIRLIIQEQATLNEEYVTTFVPMRLRASFSAEKYYREKAYEPLPYHFRVFPPPLYNLGGKLARSAAWPAPQAYTSRVHDQNGRILLVLLQAEIESSPDSADVGDVVEGSIYRNPYTSNPMEYDDQGRTIGFECLHAVFHPPNPPDICSIALGPG